MTTTRGAPVQMLLRHLGQAVEAHHSDPAGALLGGPEGQAEGGHGLVLFLPVVPGLRVVAQIAAESDVVEHKVFSFSKKNLPIPKSPFRAWLQGGKLGLFQDVS